jgi:hypothetical protein
MEQNNRITFFHIFDKYFDEFPITIDENILV